MNIPAMSFRGISVSWFRTLLRRLQRLPRVLRPLERRVVVLALIVIMVSSVWSQVTKTGSRPAFGGTYTEGFVGQPRFINPLLATADSDRALAKFIFSGLSKVDENGSLVPDIADHWETGDGGKSYTFYLKQNIFWHDGQRVTSQDVVYTINLIKDPTVQSPYLNAWRDITVEGLSESVVVFRLKDQLTLFPWMTTVGLVAAHIDRSALNTTFIGTGPYKYNKVRIRSNQIESIVLVRNTKWYGDHFPYIDSIECWFYSTIDDARSALLNQKIQGLGSNDISAKHLSPFSLPLSQKLVLFLNSQSTLFADIQFRRLVVTTDGPITAPRAASVVVDSVQANSPEFLRLMQQWQNRGLPVTVTEATLDEIQKAVAQKRPYDAIAVSIEDGPQVDQYVYWHSTQVEGSGLNFARVKNTDLDKLVTDQRRVPDLAQRDQILASIHQLVTDQVLAVTLSNRTFVYTVSNSVHILEAKTGTVPADRFNGFDKWYIKTRK